MWRSTDSHTSEEYIAVFVVDFEFTNNNIIINNIDNILRIYYVLGSYGCFIYIVDI